MKSPRWMYVLAFKLLNHLVDFYESSLEYYAIGGYSNFVNFIESAIECGHLEWEHY
jgi:hypothetical protein